MPRITPSSTSSEHSDSCSDSDSGVGLSNPKLHHQIRRKLDIMNRLHSTGVQVDIDLPQIAVIGNQSAGKSSLIEAISGITLPRESGTCTRCPTECRLARTTAPWQCIVSLRLTMDAAGIPLGQARNEQFGDVIYDKSKVEERIRRAQRAILNPHKPIESFLTDPEADFSQQKSRLSFSMNCITLQISGPDVADLSFCDLPGLIASVSTSRGGNDGSIALVESLVTSYIKKPSCIILLTVACETDFENQGAHRLAKAHDPEGKRTIGVLTKPDRIPLGEESNWLPFIRDEKEPLENNWFCVKQPSSMELKMKLSWSQARQMEEDFFSAKAPWSELEETYKKYLKTSNLVERLTTVLSDLIATRVPQIQDELEQSIMKTREVIARLPPAPTADPRSEILTLLHTFTQDLALQIQGVPDGFDSVAELGLIQAIRPEQEKFKRAIRGTAPYFWPFEKSVTTGNLLPAEFLRAEEGELFQSDGGWDGSGWVRSQVNQKIFIEEVFQRAQRARTRELPGHYPFVVQKTFIEHTIKQWEAPSEALCKSVHGIISKHVKQLVHRHFAQFGQGKLEQQVRTILQQHINECYNRAEERVKWLRRLEDVPFSLNTHYLADYKDKFLAHYKGAREKVAQHNLANKQPAPTFDFSLLKTMEAPPASRTASSTSVAAFSPNSSTSAFSFAPPPKRARPELAVNTGTTPSPVPSTSAAPTLPSTRAPSAAAGEAGALQAQLQLVATSASLAHNQAAVNKVLAGLAEMGMTGVTEADLPKLLPPDRMEPALIIMADVRAYFQVAYKRFADNVPLAVDVELVRGLESNLLKALFSQLGINGPKGDAICKEFAQENWKVADRRVDLRKKLERLEAGHMELLTVFV